MDEAVHWQGTWWSDVIMFLGIVNFLVVLPVLLAVRALVADRRNRSRWFFGMFVYWLILSAVASIVYIAVVPYGRFENLGIVFFDLLGANTGLIGTVVGTLLLFERMGYRFVRDNRPSTPMGHERIDTEHR